MLIVTIHCTHKSVYTTIIENSYFTLPCERYVVVIPMLMASLIGRVRTTTACLKTMHCRMISHMQDIEQTKYVTFKYGWPLPAHFMQGLNWLQGYIQYITIQKYCVLFCSILINQLGMMCLVDFYIHFSFLFNISDQ